MPQELDQFQKMAAFHPENMGIGHRNALVLRCDQKPKLNPSLLYLLQLQRP
jgi:hypothetical protein